MPKMFDLHFQINMDAAGITYKATTILGNNGIKFSANAATPSEALFAVAKDMEAAGMWGSILKDPSISVYPFGTTAPPQIKVDPKVKKQLPSDLTQVPHPTCTGMCTSFDLFGKDKCKGMCRQRLEL